MGICISTKKKEFEKQGIESDNNNCDLQKKITKLDSLKLDFVHEGSGDITKTYRIETRVIGSGSYGEVRRALHLPTKELRAIKMVRKSHCSEEELEALLTEINILKEADHPGIIKIYEYFTTNTMLYICMELIQGGELFDKIITVKRFNESKAADIIIQLLEAVAFLHSLNIVHRDLKPENIMIEGSRIKLIDFGTSKKKNGMMSETTGTAYYIAPEVLENNYDEKCDVWSIGVILFILLSGEPPFNGANDEEIIKKVKIGKYNFNNETWSKISKEVKALISQMLTYSPKIRPDALVCLQNEWIKMYRPKETTKFKRSQFENIRSFEYQNKLQESLYLFIIYNLVTKEERRELAEVFRMLDKNHDGRISPSELSEGFREVGMVLEPSEIDQIIRRLDFSDDRMIGFTEFIAAAFDKKALLNEERVRVCFSIFDNDGSGKISVQELKEMFSSKSETEEEIWTELLKQADQNGDGEIEYKEFEDILVKLIR